MCVPVRGFAFKNFEKGVIMGNPVVGDGAGGPAGVTGTGTGGSSGVVGISDSGYGVTGTSSTSGTGKGRLVFSRQDGSGIRMSSAQCLRADLAGF